MRISPSLFTPGSWLRRLFAFAALLPLVGTYTGAIRELHYEFSECDDGCTQLGPSHPSKDNDRHTHPHCDNCIFCNTLSMSSAVSVDIGHNDVVAMLPLERCETPSQVIALVEPGVSTARPRAPPVL